MVRTLVSLAAEEKDWLDRQARLDGTSMAEQVRRAVRLLRSTVEKDEISADQVLRQSAGTWVGEDGLTFQRRLRDEWDRRG